MDTTKEAIQAACELNVSADQLYKDWLDSEQHSAFTGGEAFATDEVGSVYTAWDGYIEGMNLELEPGKRIYQSWRSTEFATTDEDSFIEVLLEELAPGKTKITINHTNIPLGQGDRYASGWEEHYFEPMRSFYNS